MNYRAEIDGLRALAVLPVILFHAGFEWFSGGYVGVDVFFVISGYLITTIIINEMAEGKFSLVNFYERRARRILPALFFVMLACIPFAWFWLGPEDIKNFGQSLSTVSVFSSNILFWSESGYFNTVSEFKPLLHTWSLAVEEQYYILFPVFLILTWRLGLKWILSLLAIIFVSSLTLAHWGAFNIPNATFYLLPTRGWELLIGVFAAFYLKHNEYFKSDKLNQSLSLLGFGLIVYAIIAFDSTTPFPSLYALIPTIGAALLILTAVPGTWVYKLLSFSPLVGVGLISYSAYLWHYPILVFARHGLLGEVPNFLLTILLPASLMLAYISWRWVEKPFRDKEKINRKNIFRYSLIGMVCFISLGGALDITRGFQPTNFPARGHLDLGGKVMLLGDSHARHLAFGLSKYFGEDLVRKYLVGCLPFNVDRYNHLKQDECVEKTNEALNEFINDDSYSLLVLSHLGPAYLDNTAFRNLGVHQIKGGGGASAKNPNPTGRWEFFEQGIRETFSELSLLSNKKVVYLIDVPELVIDDTPVGIFNRACLSHIDRQIFGKVFRVYENTTAAETCKIPREEYDQRASRYLKLLDEVSSDFPKIIFVNPTSILCDNEYCYGIKNDILLYRDLDHLSNHGSLMVADYLIEELLAEPSN